MLQFMIIMSCYDEVNDNEICVNAQQSEPQSVDCSVPQGSVLGPMKFTAYIEDLADLINTINWATICTQMTHN